MPDSFVKFVYFFFLPKRISPFNAFQRVEIFETKILDYFFVLSFIHPSYLSHDEFWGSSDNGIWMGQKKIKELEDLSLLKLIPVEAKGIPKVRDNLKQFHWQPCICFICICICFYAFVEAPRYCDCSSTQCRNAQ